MDEFQEIMAQQQARFDAERERQAKRTPEEVAAELAKQELSEREDRAKVARRRDDALAALIPPKHRWARANAPELSERVGMPGPGDWARHPPAAPFVLLTGPAGSGKTSLACAAMATAIIEHRARLSRCFVVSAHRLGLARSQARLGQGEPEIVERAMGCEWLILDGLGETPSDPPSSALPDVIFDRYESERVTWVTTGLHSQAIGERWGAGFLRRLIDGAVIVKLAKATSKQVEIAT